MELVYFRGLDCQLACIINIASLHGINFKNAFHNLWSETEFFDNKKFDIFTSDRVKDNFNQIGVKIELLDCQDVTITWQSFSKIENDEYFIIGLDFFYIPWSIIYHHFHGVHYFFAQKKDRYLLCFDPTYNEKYIKMEFSEVIPYAFELIKINISVINIRFEPYSDAKQLLKVNQQFKADMINQIQACETDKNSRIQTLIKKITVLRNNRYLFKEFFSQFETDKIRNPFQPDFFKQWEAVKYGLTKAMVKKDHIPELLQTVEIFKTISRQEKEIANALTQLTGFFELY